MGERPILFRDDMVQAILDGRKTVTRRVGMTWATVQPGTRLWVREAHALDVPGCEAQRGVSYRADHADPKGDGPAHPMRWRPSIHMPRWACRLTLEVVSVTEEQVGLDFGGRPNGMRQVDDAEARREGFGSYLEFLAAWRTMHADHTGPVYRVEFRRVEPTHA